MGDRYTLELACAYCGASNDDVWYAPSCGSEDFKCRACDKWNDIRMGFHAVRREPKGMLCSFCGAVVDPEGHRWECPRRDDRKETP